MLHHDLLTMYSAKAEEYFIAASFLLLFIPFWRFVTGKPAAEAEGARVPMPVTGWFNVPESLYFHPGHAWARLDQGNLVTVGMDDFAHKLMGKVSSIELPKVGAHILQGEKGWTLAQDSKSVDMLSPVDGTVVAVNERTNDPGALGSDPYGEGWLLQVKVPRLKANTTNLLSGNFAQRWMEEVCQELSGRISPDLGLLSQDGGLPVEGMARSLEPSDWDRVARKFFLTEARDAR